ncbi:Bug family tripartite tricarboxylate transporter substrate binding protein [Cupriavidus oxalaticus]|uniref:ABC transporter substrate-binding protein n=1 Tax=Cupriavidus oxalaticus TaxID=96344 RepID=A0A976GBJ6_9BURK|nr:tripartite tricarboxylate transporter substrate binding protein [Cupriavidus oxalaticus]QRQ86362.1 tripartite tricarboxylate transporter substrate binding protein [Cupriavidus oxalaticus]QRQ95311.1 tripartite tricarboxylate transporter substrate binding protein [Cupriavidus oxalaticus]WQD83965.1 tripartite tricarboxylate transporter substrate binding protein [Cupriavidus oxalaticus]SPC17267.1 ABC transporter substrate-binding protein [Cupriavidus oxalaticus]
MSFLRPLRGLALVASLLASVAHAQYPDKPIRFIVPFPPGGAVDVLGRVSAKMISDSTHRPVVVDNVAGAGGAIGSKMAAQASPDGYTLLMGSTSSLSINPIYQKVGYDPVKDFTPIALVASVPHVLVVDPALPVKTLQEFIAYAKARSGKLNFASSGPGTPHHVAGEMFNQMAGVNLVHVPYKGTGPGLIDVMSGQVSLMSVEILAAAPQVIAGKVRALGIAADQRSPLLPDVPTVSEAGLKGFEVTSWYGVVAPAGIPQAVATKLSAAIGQGLTSPEAVEKLKALGARPVGGTPDQFRSFLQNENTKWGKVMMASDISNK